VRIAFLMLMAAGGVNLPTNEGLFAPVHTVFREGSLLNPAFPAATIFGNQMCDEVLDCIMSALADALPDRVTAAWAKSMCTAMQGTDPRTGEPYMTLTVFQRNGPGAMRGAHGWDALGFCGVAGQMRATDPEMFEITSPHFLEYHELWPDSAGAGRWRGGYGTRSAWRSHGLAAHGVTLGEGVEVERPARAPGLDGGAEATANRLLVEYPDGTTHEWGSKELISVPPGTVVRSWCGGGAGYGDPRERPLDEIDAELRDGLLTPARAEREYAVAVTADGRGVDAAGTRRIREREGS
jgi:N-methylhydantoinase B